MKYKAVLFDIFGTLVLMNDLKTEMEEWLGRFHECLQPHGLDMPRGSFDEVCFDNLERDIPVTTEDGLTIFERRVNAICTHLGLQVMKDDIKSTVVSLLEVWNKYAVLDPDCHPLLEELAQQYTLGVVSNFDHPPYIRRILRDLDLNKYFSTVVISGDFDFKKPDPRIFHLALEELGLEPGDAVYIGDSEEDIIGSRGAGLKPVLIQRDIDLNGVPEVFKREYAGTDVITVGKLPEIMRILER
jgi:HAD superfamily hydrolase (TIGR01549 family)